MSARRIPVTAVVQKTQLCIFVVVITVHPYEFLESFPCVTFRTQTPGPGVRFRHPGPPVRVRLRARPSSLQSLEVLARVLESGSFAAVFVVFVFIAPRRRPLPGLHAAHFKPNFELPAAFVVRAPFGDVRAVVPAFAVGP